MLSHQVIRVASFAVALASAACGAEPRIAFVSERDGNKEVRLVDLKGEEQRLTNNPGDDFPAAASPTGNEMLVLSVGPGPGGVGSSERLTVHPLDGGAPKQVVPPSARTRNPTWSPDGEWLVFEWDARSFRDLYRVDRDGSNLRRLTDNRQGNFEPSVSPDGEWIAFVSSRDDNAELYRARAADGTGVERLTAFHRDDWSPVWSPDGRRLAFVSNREQEDRIFLLNADGTGVRRLTGTPAGAGVLEKDPVWSPDGTRIAFVAIPRGGRPRVRIVELRSRRSTEIAAGAAGGESDPAWSPDGRRLAFTSDRDGDAEIYVADADGGDLRRLTRSPGADWLPRWVGGRRAGGGVLAAIFRIAGVADR